MTRGRYHLPRLDPGASALVVLWSWGSCLFLFVALYGSAGAASALLGLPLTFGLIGLAVLEMIRGNWWPKKRVLESITGIASALGFLFAVTGWEGSGPSSLTLALISASVICVAFTVAMFLQK